jgi:hypothetical protein
MGREKRSLPRAALPYAAFILRYLLQPVTPGSVSRAAAETEQPLDGDRWFWADDNAKILEFLATPSIWQSWPAECAEIFGFLDLLCEEEFIFRRTAHPRLEKLEEAEGRARFRHGLLDIEADLPRGLVSVGLRFHDGRTARNVALTGNYVQFNHRGTHYVLDAEETITESEIAFQAPELRLIHRSALHFEARGQRVRLGTLTYTYTFDAASTFFDVAAELAIDPGIEVEDVVLTIGQDDVSAPEAARRYTHVFAESPAGPPHAFAAAEPGMQTLPCAGAPYWSIVQLREMKGFALAIHSIPETPARLAEIVAVVREAGLLHYVIGHHAFPGRHTGTTLRAAERKTITSGGFYDRVASCSALLRRHAGAAAGRPGPLDFSISYDYGAELLAFARCHSALSQPGMPAEAAAIADRSRVLFDRYHTAYVDNLLAAHRAGEAAIFSRPLAFVVMALAEMWRSTLREDYRTALRETVAVLLEFERRVPGLADAEDSVFLMAQAEGSRHAFLDCQAAALLALVHAAEVLEDAAVVASLERGLGALHLVTVRNEFAGVHKLDTVAVVYREANGEARCFNGFWNFSIALALRAIAALQASSSPVLAGVRERQAGRLDMLQAVMEQQLARSLREREDCLEVLTSYLSGEGNSETQPWVALALTEPG